MVEESNGIDAVGLSELEERALEFEDLPAFDSGPSAGFDQLFAENRAAV